MGLCCTLHAGIGYMYVCVCVFVACCGVSSEMCVVVCVAVGSCTCGVVSHIAGSD